MPEADPHRYASGAHLYNHDIVEAVDARRVSTFDRLDADQRAARGQFGTPAAIARLMASMFTFEGVRDVRLLDPGAGVGSLTAAFVAAACRSPTPPRSIHVTAYEVEPLLADALEATLASCETRCHAHGIRFASEVIIRDFIEEAVLSETDLFQSARPTFNFAIQNPPYRKIRSDSHQRLLLSRAGIEVTNLYAAFVALTVRLLEDGGQLVAITPRSFCNGPYFRPFRRDFLRRMRLTRLHSFDSRSATFADDRVLQENIIVSAVAGAGANPRVLITSSSGEPGADELRRLVDHDKVVPPHDSACVMHLITDGAAERVADQIGRFPSCLDAMGLQISTGKVVDFRVKELLRDEADEGSFPLIYPLHLRSGRTRWPVVGARKPNALANLPGVEKLLVPPGRYVLLKRFSSKEQQRRLDAYVYDSATVAPDKPVGFENHVNYIHDDGQGLEADLAIGLAVYLNSSLVDLYFRLFSGHTQVNAADLRGFPLPDRTALTHLGQAAGTAALDPRRVDDLVRTHLLDGITTEGDPVALHRKVQEARQALKELGFPASQHNDRSALTLLALLDLQAETPWSEASAPCVGVHEMMAFFAERYGKQYKPGSRESVRRHTVHQFRDAGLIQQNPDEPERATNSAKYVYQIVPEALAMLRTLGTAEWARARDAYLAAGPTLSERYQQARAQVRIPVVVAEGQTLHLSPGGQNVLIKAVIDEFIHRFAPGARLIYVGDTASKWAHFDEAAFQELGIRVQAHGKFPDIVAFYEERNWLLLIEAVTSHGPVDPKRHLELAALFRESSAGLVYVTTFLTRKDLTRCLGHISWETEVWIAESPGHMIHFDGERFLGPY